jgi:large subunit ribosomal protein LP0
MPVSKEKKAYADKLKKFLLESESVLIVQADNVGSKQMQQIRIALRGTANVLMGKNTTIRKVFRDFLKEHPNHPTSQLVEHINGNIGFVFTNGDVAKIRDTILSNKVPAPARPGAVAPSDVFVEPGPTGCDPGQTSWFQALNIPTKINRGQIEMISRVHLIKEGDKVGESESALLDKLEIKPFAYALKVLTVYQNGEVFDANVLDITEDDMISKFMSGVRAVAALGLALGIPSKASFVHSLNNAFKACVSIALGSDFKFERATAFEEFLKNPGAFAPAAAAGGAAKAAEPEPEPEEEEEGDMFGLFD